MTRIMSLGELTEAVEALTARVEHIEQALRGGCEHVWDARPLPGTSPHSQAVAVCAKCGFCPSRGGYL